MAHDAFMGAEASNNSEASWPISGHRRTAPGRRRHSSAPMLMRASSLLVEPKSCCKADTGPRLCSDSENDGGLGLQGADLGLVGMVVGESLDLMI